MTLPPEKIHQWARRIHSTRLSWTYAVISEALEGGSRLRHCDYEIFAQGSYANATNIEGDSDVDLVVQLVLPFEEQISALSADERERFFERYEYSPYGWEDFRADVIATLQAKYFVREGKKCVDVRDWDALTRVPADVLPAIQYRNYSRFTISGEVYAEGVFFRDSKHHAIVNYPKVHIKAGNAKDAATDGRFKQLIRVVKNARNYAGEQVDDFDPKIAPSYFVECLLFNVPEKEFAGELEHAYEAVIGWLDANRHMFAGLRCQNGMADLVGSGPEQWRPADAQRLVDVLKGL